MEPPPLPPPPRSQELDTREEANPEVKWKRRKSAVVDLFNANFQLKSIPNSAGKYKLEIIKLEQEEIVNPPDDQDSRLFGWLVEIRLRASGRHYDRFYYHLSKKGAKFRSTAEVINYILYGTKVGNRGQHERVQKCDKAKKSEKCSKKNKRKEDEIESSNSNSPPAEGDVTTAEDKHFWDGSWINLLNRGQQGNDIKYEGVGLKNESLSEKSRGLLQQDLCTPQDSKWGTKLKREDRRNGDSLHANIGETLMGGSWNSFLSMGGNGNGTEYEGFALKSKSLFGNSNGILSTGSIGNGIEFKAIGFQNKSLLGNSNGIFHSHPYTRVDFQNRTKMQRDWSMGMNRTKSRKTCLNGFSMQANFGETLTGGSWNNLLNNGLKRKKFEYEGVGLKSRSLFGSSSTHLHSYPNTLDYFQHRTKISGLHGHSTNDLHGYSTYDGNNTSTFKNVVRSGESFHGNFVNNKNGIKDSLNSIIIITDDNSKDSGKLNKDNKGFSDEAVPSENEMKDVKNILYVDSEVLFGEKMFGPQELDALMDFIHEAPPSVQPLKDQDEEVLE